MITCQEFIASLDDFVAGDLDSASRSESEEHLGGCDSCVAYAGSYRKTIELEKLLSKGDFRASLPADLARRIAERRKR